MYGYKKDLVILGIFIFSALSVFLATPDIFASAAANSLSGKILLQVEQYGEAWYVNPGDEKRYYLGRPNDAFSLMRNLGIGITNSNLNKIPVAENNLPGETDSDGDGLSDALEDSLGIDKNKVDTDSDGYNDRIEILSGYNPLGEGKLPHDKIFANLQGGKIFLQVQSKGEAWYVSPANNKRYFLGRPADAFNLMRSLGLGITNVDLNKIPSSQLSSTKNISQSSSSTPVLVPISSTPALAPITSTAPSNLPPAPILAPTTQTESVQCNSLDCFIGLAETCKIGEATYSLTIPFPLAIRETMKTIIYSKIAGKNSDGSCILTQQSQGGTVTVSEVDRVLMLSLGLSNEQIDAQLLTANESINNESVLKAVLTCAGSSENIATYLKNSKEGFNSLNCLLQNGEKERACTINPGLNCVTKIP